MLPEIEEGVMLILYVDITDVKWLTLGAEKLKRQCVVKQPERKFSEESLVPNTQAMANQEAKYVPFIPLFLRCLLRTAQRTKAVG